jgi:hypothetical protein
VAGPGYVILCLSVHSWPFDFLRVSKERLEKLDFSFGMPRRNSFACLPILSAEGCGPLQVSIHVDPSCTPAS